MRRRPRLVLRPRLPRRALVWFPPSASLAAVEAFRARHDPQAAEVPAHVTLVFPFASSLSALQIGTHVGRVVGGWPVLPVVLAGSSAFEAQWVHLRVTRGRHALTELHDRLYRGILRPFLREEFMYEPHLTIGRAADAHACGAMLQEAEAVLRAPIEATLHSLTLITLRGNGRIERHSEIALGGT
jgi:2'-5' RNA ligase